VRTGLNADICPMTWKMRADSVIGFEGIVAKVRAVKFKMYIRN
jgi:hypothetical protein